MSKYNKSDWYFGRLKLTDEDKIGLQNFDLEILKKFNKFDIELKETFGLNFIDLIDYENGEVIVVSPFQNKTTNL